MSGLRLERWMTPSPKQVFAAFEDPFLLRRWYGAPPGCYRTYSDAGDVELGELFRVDLIDARGVAFAQLGRVLAMELS